MLGGTVIYNLLLNNTDITDIVGDNIYPLYIPQEIPLPCITYQMVSTDPNGTKDGVSTLDVERYQVNVYSDNFDEMNSLQKLVRTTLDFYTGEVAGLDVQRVWFDGQFTGFSDSSGLTGVYQYSHDYHIRINPDQSTPNALELTFDDIANVPVNNPYSVSDWNTFFDLPNWGIEFVNVNVNGNVVTLSGFYNNVSIKPGLFAENINILNVIDNGTLDTVSIVAFANSSIETFNSATAQLIGISCFSGCSNLTSFIGPNVLSIEKSAFMDCTSLTTINIPLTTTLGESVTDDTVFEDISGNVITLTIPNVLMTCNGGNPHASIQYLIDNNTVTIITV